jgi:hypothetical protein
LIATKTERRKEKLSERMKKFPEFNHIQANVHPVKARGNAVSRGRLCAIRGASYNRLQHVNVLQST